MNATGGSIVKVGVQELRGTTVLKNAQREALNTWKTKRCGSPSSICESASGKKGVRKAQRERTLTADGLNQQRQERNVNNRTERKAESAPAEA